MGNEYVLFAPIGGSDPINNCCDGAVLHICRRFKPSVVCLYLTKEMLERHRRDDRYRYSIRRLYGEVLDADVAIEIEEREDIADPQKFDMFFDEFKPILQRMHNEHPTAQLLVNISSGTPAMKSELNLISTMSAFPITPIQVNSPKAGQNTVHEDPDSYDVKLMWEMNEDNEPGAPDRTCIPNHSNIRALVTSENICGHVDAFDYNAALREAEGIRALFSDDALTLIEAASERMNLNPGVLQKKLGRDSASEIMRVYDSGKMPLVEYILWLNIKYRRGDLADFIRGITPALYRLSLYYLKEKLQIDILRYCTGGNQQALFVIRDKLDGDGLGREILEYLDSCYPNGYRDSPLSSDVCIKLIEHYEPIKHAGSVEPIADNFAKMRRFEMSIRNLVAHDIAKISEEDIRSKTGIGSLNAMALIKKLAKAVLGMKEDDFTSYDRLNERIKLAVRSHCNIN